jgi:asparagine synthase (glutamine-hydrolysing)
MCGIAGSLGVGQSAVARKATAVQLEKLRHRGPDATGTFSREEGSIGQARLSVIDLVTGDPPVTDEGGRIGAVLNGEIYNFAVLREELRQDGHRLSTHGDTEVLAHLAERVEPSDLARRLDGMFAFAIWDSERHRLLLGRDRLGKKPLYFWSGNGRLVFGSEIKALLVHPWVTSELDLEAIEPYLTFGYVPTPGTFFRGIESVPPGSVLVAEPGSAPRIEQYYELPGQIRSDVLALPMKEAAREVRRLLEQAVDKRLLSDVPLGAFLSGGLDSSAVVAAMVRHSGKRVRTFTIGFEDNQGFDERPWASQVARHLGTDHTEFVVKPDAADLLERLVALHDQPFGDSSALPTYLLSELTRKDVTVALCGDGGDELFAGYGRVAASLAISHLGQGGRRLAVAGARLLAVFPDRYSTLRLRLAKVKRLLGAASLPPQQALLRWISYVPAEVRSELLRTPSNLGTQQYEKMWRAATGVDLLGRLLALNIHSYLLDDLLVKVDRMSMAHGLEVRSPFLDTQLVDFALRLPSKLKLRGLSLKRVLKVAMADALPAEIIERPKHGFGLPLARWFRTDLRSFVESRLGNNGARVRRHLASGPLDALLAEHMSATLNHEHALWTLLTLEEFLRQQGW